MKNKTMPFVLLAFLITVTALLATQCSFEPTQPQDGKNVSRNIDPNDIKANDFSEERVLIVLSHEASFRALYTGRFWRFGYSD
jgi:hypothetical protein